MTAPATAGAGAATDRVARTLTRALGVAALLFGALAVGGFTAQYPAFAPWWSWGVVATTVVPLLVAAALSGLAPRRMLERLCTVAALGQLAGLALLVPALADGGLPGDAAPWLLQVSALGTCAAAIAWRPLAVWAYLAACVVVLGLDRWLAGATASEHLALTALQDAAYALLFDAVFTALALAARRAGRQLDHAADAAIAGARATAAADAAQRERIRMEALLHDSVLSALLASAHGSPRAPAAARAALDRLSTVDDPTDDTPVDGEALLWRLQALTTELAPEATFGYVPAPLRVPAEVAHAVQEATAEALRNSVRHAGPAARAVHARLAPAGLEVTVIDDGRGFDPREVGPARLGVAVSIVDRMRALPGGRATVVSRPGVGTRVAIAWQPS